MYIFKIHVYLSSGKIGNLRGKPSKMYNGLYLKELYLKPVLSLKQTTFKTVYTTFKLGHSYCLL